MSNARSLPSITVLTILCFLVTTHARAPASNNLRISVTKFASIFTVGVTPSVVLDNVVHRCARTILINIHDLGIVRGVGWMLPVQRFQTGVEAGAACDGWTCALVR